MNTNNGTTITIQRICNNTHFSGKPTARYTHFSGERLISYVYDWPTTFSGMYDYNDLNRISYSTSLVYIYTSIDKQVMLLSHKV